jgi:hypothetical protein
VAASAASERHQASAGARPPPRQALHGGAQLDEGIDQKTGLPIDYDPTKDIQVYSGLQNQTMSDRNKKLCPSHEGGNNYWSAPFIQRTRLLYIPSRPTCNENDLVSGRSCGICSSRARCSSLNQNKFAHVRWPPILLTR